MLLPIVGGELPTKNRRWSRISIEWWPAALRNELGESRRSIKTVLGWTGACERTAKNWLLGNCGPSGHHLVQLAENSDGYGRTLGSSHRVEFVGQIRT